jgi:hypothetical protein
VSNNNLSYCGSPRLYVVEQQYKLPHHKIQIA